MSAASELPYVDEHAAIVAADRAATWESLLRVAEATVSSGGAAGFARILDCADIEPAGPRPLAVGSTIPGFRVAVAEAPAELSLVGSHRFSDYALIFRLEELGAARTRLRAETRAEFPGFKGAVYKGLVIGTRLHVLATRRILGATKSRAERPSRRAAGLCDSCRHQRLVPNTRGSVFSLCERSREDPAYPRYPRIPVLRCPGFEPASPQPAPGRRR